MIADWVIWSAWHCLPERREAREVEAGRVDWSTILIRHQHHDRTLIAILRDLVARHSTNLHGEQGSTVRVGDLDPAPSSRSERVRIASAGIRTTVLRPGYFRMGPRHLPAMLMRNAGLRLSVLRNCR